MLATPVPADGNKQIPVDSRSIKISTHVSGEMSEVPQHQWAASNCPLKNLETNNTEQNSQHFWKSDDPAKALSHRYVISNSVNRNDGTEE